MQTRTIYMRKWHCIRPGRWRSDCGWYEVVRIHRGLWLGVDLMQGRKTERYADTLTTAVYHLIHDLHGQASH